MESRTEKLALARKKLKDHQEKKTLIQDVSTKTFFHGYTEPNVGEPIIEGHILNQDAEKSSNNLNQKEEAVLDVNTISTTNNRIDHTRQTLENELLRTETLEEDLLRKDTEIMNLSEEKVKLLEQLEFSQTVLISKNSEIMSLTNKLKLLEEQNSSFQIRIQQLTDGLDISSSENLHLNKVKDAAVSIKKCELEDQLQLLQKERDQITVHYEHYVAEVNEQLKSTIAKNYQLSDEVQNLLTRESSLIDQISQMEIQLQNMKKHETIIGHENDQEIMLFQEKNKEIEDKLKKMQQEYDKTLNKLAVAEIELQNFMKKEYEQDRENGNVLKLSADIASDKIAAQRATEQNIKLKDDLQELEKAFVKMSQDKLELTEKISAEKYLNRELTIKLSEKEEKLKTTHVALIAKDNEMIRLLNNYSELEKQLPIAPEEVASLEIEKQNHLIFTEDSIRVECPPNENCVNVVENFNETSLTTNDGIIPREDAMLKLQERFFKIMEDVANLSDEKHRLEHIVTQLQNETETICEYVALYQQQRSLLKQRDEERSAQIKAFQTECSLLREYLSQLSEVIVKLTEDEHLASYFDSEFRRNEITSTLDLLQKLKDNVIINSDTNCAQLNNFYPCACCSGKLIDV